MVTSEMSYKILNKANCLTHKNLFMEAWLVQDELWPCFQWRDVS